MKLRIAFAAAIAIVLAATIAGAKSSTVKYNATVRITSHSTHDGVCTDSDPHANLCPSMIDCVCESFSATYTGPAGKGTATGIATTDGGEGFAPDAAGGTGCSPVYGVVRVSGKKEIETFEFNGYSCLGLNGIGVLNGGCVMGSSSLFSKGAVATCSASEKTGIFSIRGLAKK